MPDSYLPRENLQHEKRTYRVHDNGGRPFEVTASYEAIIVKSLDTESSSDDLVYTKTVLEIKSFDGLWWGFDNGKRKFMRNEEPEHGSSILVKVTNKEYIFIGWKIQSFSTDETIIDYASPIGNSDVPYPVAYGKNNLYFMLESEFTSRQMFNIDTNFYYNTDDLIDIWYKIKDDDVKHPLVNLKTLVERLW